MLDGFERKLLRCGTSPAEKLKILDQKIDRSCDRDLDLE